MTTLATIQPVHIPTMGYDIDALSEASDLSSLASVSPRSSLEPEARYPTPSSQLEAETDHYAAEGSSARQARPAKRRRNPLPKERTTQYLNLSKSLHEQSDQHYLLVQTLRHQKDVIVIAGAGISTSAGSKFLFGDSAAFHI
jgi:NAD-dependent histone deacetylase SIR2